MGVSVVPGPVQHTFELDATFLVQDLYIIYEGRVYKLLEDSDSVLP